MVGVEDERFKGFGIDAVHGAVVSVDLVEEAAGISALFLDRTVIIPIVLCYDSLQLWLYLRCTLLL